MIMRTTTIDQTKYEKTYGVIRPREGGDHNKGSPAKLNGEHMSHFRTCVFPWTGCLALSICQVDAEEDSDANLLRARTMGLEMTFLRSHPVDESARDSDELRVSPSPFQDGVGATVTH